MMSLSYHFNTEVGTVIRAQCIAEHLAEKGYITVIIDRILLIHIELIKKSSSTTTTIIINLSSTSNFSGLCIPGIDCIRWEVGWLPKSELM